MSNSVTDRPTDAQPSNADVLGALRVTYRLVAELAAKVDRLEAASRLGFGEAPYTRTINCKRRDDCPSWYFWNGPEGAEPIQHSAITGYVLDISIKQGTFKNKPTHNLQVLLGCGDRNLILDSGFKPGEESAFSRCLLAGLSGLSFESLQRPITIAVSPGTDEEKALLCNVYQDGQKIGQYDKNADWNSLFYQIKATVQRANQ